MHLRLTRLTTIASAMVLSAGFPARAEADVFPVQGEAMVDYSVGAGTETSSVHFSLAYVRPLAPVIRGWRMFGGIGPAVSALHWWKREDRLARDNYGAGSPGLEGRVGFVHGNDIGAPRILVRVMPTWAPGVNEMGLPGERGPAVRVGVGVAAPAWLLGRLSTDDEDLEPIAWIAYALAIVPTEIEYVFQHVPGGNRHGFALGWSF